MATEHSDRQSDAPMALSAWYGDPLSEPQAQALLRQVQRAQQRAYAAAVPCPDCGLREMIAAFWLGRPVESHYRNLLHTAPDARSRALVELVYGQLLASRRLAGALEHLARGFALGAALLEPAPYFAVLNRHEILAELSYSPRPARPLTLDGLLREAAVIRALRGRPGRHGRRGGDPGDTVG
jgi:hypothetical protein